MNILGINAYAHDSGVALVRGGSVAQVLEEERFNRIRKTTDFPNRAIRYLRSEVGLDLSEVDWIAFPWSRIRIARMVARMVFGRFPPAYRLLSERASPQMNFLAALRFSRVRSDVARAFASRTAPKVRYVPHHLAHACNSFFLSPFESAAVLVMDGFGDDCSTSSYLARGSSIQLLRKNEPLNSLGILYAMVTKHLGYKPVLDEGTVMALSAYGSDSLCERFRRVVSHLAHGDYQIEEKYFHYHRYGELRPVSDLFVKEFGRPRAPGDPIEAHHRDLARALQETLETTVLHIARELRRTTAEKNLCVAGGVALNCLANGRIARESGFDRVFVSPNPNDSGQALGAALALGCLGQSGNRPEFDGSAFHGPGYGEADFLRELEARSLTYRIDSDVAEFAAAELTRGRTVGWFQGAAEMGPRALGNRSILADPRDPKVRGRLNKEIKRREAFRPYGSSVLVERASEFFEDDVDSPFMSFAVRVRPERQSQVPAIVARDGTARIQTVTRNGDPRFRRLIEAFDRRTSVPMVLNTSFNVQEPVISTPMDAIRTFVDSSLDTLILGEVVVTS